MGQNDKTTEVKPKTNGFFKKLSSLVYESTPEETTESNAVNSTPVTTDVNSPSKFTYSNPVVNTTTGVPNTMVNPNANGMFDENFYNSFLKLIEANNIDGIDYFEFSKALKALANTGMADPLKYQAAFSSLRANSNLTKEALLKTADFYIEKLGQEEKEFNNEMQHEIDIQVNSRLNQAKAKQEEITRKQEEISKLQLEMGTLQGEIGALNMEAQQTQMKIESTAKNFKVSMDVLISQIGLDKQNINTYIQQ